MKNRLLQTIILLFTSILFGQSPKEITKYLKTHYAGKPEESSVGYYLYTNDTLKIYPDNVLANVLPKYKFYNFIIDEKGCYGFSSRIGIITKNDKDLVEQFGLWAIGSDQDFNPEFINIFKTKRVRDDKDFEAYVFSIAKLLFSTYYENEFKKGLHTKNCQTFESKNRGIITIEYSNNQITNIKYRMVI
ncbi:hypothetical protein FNO01nite_34480 [Flavobacterium noncentrifugens]|uniref:Uncharacterized protein n=1 Tax=Flavobacterium noncentrifugens TaxID=1128970 RepID=A0A1G9C289_9FLAO|nr:hypothetical protein [Flavobacterium noncentrifugens]GEP52776.1 hypothetical protein FNO01nite_34480 [Flavobacterium noncentrifugens]SDK45758.1 hypothetical protein SAMN04487935_3447 [Flavobacterium noncentrifugens]